MPRCQASTIVLPAAAALADGKPLRRSIRSRVSVASGIDWFDVRGELEFDGGARLPLATALQAQKRELVQAVLGADQSLLAQLTREDLAALLG